MARARKRVRLEAGRKVDLNEVMRQGSPKLDRRILFIFWTPKESGESVFSGVFQFELCFDGSGLVRLTLGGVEQTLRLRGVPRHFGGFQWYFVCPVTGRRASVLWLPPGAKRFASRLAWGRQVAYDSQFETPHDRAFSQSENIRRRLRVKGCAAADDAISRKPKGMHWRTYYGLLDRWEAYELQCNLHFIRALTGLTKQLV
jgi:hypothetical protein